MLKVVGWVSIDFDLKKKIINPCCSVFITGSWYMYNMLSNSYFSLSHCKRLSCWFSSKWLLLFMHNATQTKGLSHSSWNMLHFYVVCMYFYKQLILHGKHFLNPLSIFSVSLIFQSQKQRLLLHGALVLSLLLYLLFRAEHLSVDLY